MRRIAEDPRRGRLLFFPALSTILMHRRAEAIRLFARLLGLQAQEMYGISGDSRLELLADFLVGGLAQTLTSWLNGTLDVSEEEIVEQCTEIFLSVGQHA